MKFAVMQPYFLPYIGYFQLMEAVDKFVVYDNIEYTKKGWINRNRILINGEPQYFTVNIEKGSDYASVKERRVSQVFEKERRKVLARIESNYRKAPFFRETMTLTKECLECEQSNLFEFVFFSICRIAEHLNIKTELIVSSKLPIDHTLKNKHRLWAIGKYLGAQHYINPIGGVELYKKQEFREHGLNLSFHKAHLSEYNQLGSLEFRPALSVLDVLMNLGIEGTRRQLTDFTLL